MELGTSRLPSSSNTSMATRKRLWERIQCVAIETARIGIRYPYGSDRKYVERWDPRGDVTRRGLR